MLPNAFWSVLCLIMSIAVLEARFLFYFFFVLYHTIKCNFVGSYPMLNVCEICFHDAITFYC